MIDVNEDEYSTFQDDIDSLTAEAERQKTAPKAGAPPPTPSVPNAYSKLFTHTQYTSLYPSLSPPAPPAPSVLVTPAAVANPVPHNNANVPLCSPLCSTSQLPISSNQTLCYGNPPACGPSTPAVVNASAQLSPKLQEKLPQEDLQSDKDPSVPSSPGVDAARGADLASSGQEDDDASSGLAELEDEVEDQEQQLPRVSTQEFDARMRVLEDDVSQVKARLVALGRNVDEKEAARRSLRTQRMDTIVQLRAISQQEAAKKSSGVPVTVTDPTQPQQAGQAVTATLEMKPVRLHAGQKLGNEKEEKGTKQPQKEAEQALTALVHLQDLQRQQTRLVREETGLCDGISATHQEIRGLERRLRETQRQMDRLKRAMRKQDRLSRQGSSDTAALAEKRKQEQIERAKRREIEEQALLDRWGDEEHERLKREMGLDTTAQPPHPQSGQPPQAPQPRQAPP